MIYFFFFKQKTAYEMRISDWSSDVCSSDLVLADGLLDQVGAQRDGGEVHVPAGRMVGVGDGEDKHPLQRRNDVEIDALQAGRVAGGAVMDDDVLVALAADDVDGGLDLADRGVAGIELQAHAAAGGAAQQRCVVDIGRGDLDGVAAQLFQQLDLVLEADRGEEGEAQAVAVPLELAPFVDRKSTRLNSSH